jgi:glucosamine 6-phosphate synthetase-like amidotransferase/phosphosugar isomerase protein
MCGLVGMAGKLGKLEEDAFRDLLIVDSLRGPHSTGVASVDNRCDVSVFKKAVDPFEYFTYKKVDALFYGVNRILMGHNRWATRGAINHRNAHPFKIGNITGMHNGTLTNQRLLIDHTKFEVDSENIIHSINEEGIDETHENLDGAYALVYYDSAADKLNIIRNSERTLFYTYNEKKTVLFWASEPWMLHGILHRRGIKHDKVHAFAPLHLHTFDIPNNITSYPPAEIADPHIRKLKAYEAAPIVPWNGKVNQPPAQRQGTKQGSLVRFKVENVEAQKRQAESKEVHVISGTTLDDKVPVTVWHGGDQSLIDDLCQGGNVHFVGAISSVRVYSQAKTYALNPQDITVIHPETEEEPDEKKSQQKSCKDSDGNSISEAEFISSTNGGCCAWCASPVDVDESFLWISDKDVLCSACKDLDDVKEYLPLYLIAGGAY